MSGMVLEFRAALQVLLAEAAKAGYRFVPPTPETHRRVNARKGNEEARDLTDIFGWSRPFAREILPPRLFEALITAEVVAPRGPLWQSRLRIATLRNRFYLHSAYPTSNANSVFFGPDTYRFVRAALQQLPVRHYQSVIDVCCGSGAGGLAFAAERSVDELCLIDINPRALTLAHANSLFQSRRARIVESDLFNGVDGFADLILANPPYLADPGGRVYRDGGGQIGTGLSLKIIREGITHLRPGGILLVYTGTPIMGGKNLLSAAVEQILPAAGYLLETDEIDPDVFGEELDHPSYAGVDRIAVMTVKLTRLRQDDS
jgi:release factor glutamine methyltransferase